MNSGLISGVVTALLLLAFIGGWIWAWSARRRPDFDAAAQLALEHDDPPVSAQRAARPSSRD